MIIFKKNHSITSAPNFSDPISKMALPRPVHTLPCHVQSSYPHLVFHLSVVLRSRQLCQSLSSSYHMLFSVRLTSQEPIAPDTKGRQERESQISNKAEWDRNQVEQRGEQQVKDGKKCQSIFVNNENWDFTAEERSHRKRQWEAGTSPMALDWSHRH